ncbi:Tat (twin-arginine translocation) pathway signal sequence [Methylomagnum ishizawai]|uniref:Tat (Twin-arginine translocation) pathway signal sequence n=1 Tax=Methylomagnum ishizawai TaxID=1760988 RepID=A0A1Y6D160_9GAMM|nr:twin-arginine translocation signal domain-containing protein [Methylomagnum ishizawai]SMF96659.1 Tat (twin-arginine translocation) pathway signal sequence [Methylomagnum ishizawai]
MNQNVSDIHPNESALADHPAPLSAEDRRDFLKRAGRYAVGAPAAVLLLQAASIPARADAYGPPVSTTLNVPSDRRLKADIVREGTLPNGVALYSFRYTWSQQRFVGVMADEIEAVKPQAVSIHRTGYKMVDYSAVLN